MTIKETLETSIQKALDNGYNPIPWQGKVDKIHFNLTEGSKEVQFFGELNDRLYAGGGDTLSIPEIIYDQSFAKAIWGEVGMIALASPGFMITTLTEDWRYHIQRMIISEHPLKYLGENL